MKLTLRNLSIRAKLMAGFGLILVLLIAFGGVAVEQIVALRETMALSRGKELQLDSAKTSLHKLRDDFQEFLDHDEPMYRKKILQDEPVLFASIENELKAYRNAPGLTAPELEGHQKLIVATAKYKQSRLAWFKSMDESKVDEAFAWRARSITPLEAEIEEALTHLTEVNDASRDVVPGIVNFMLALMAAMGGAAFVVGVAVATIVYQSINRPLKALRSAIDRIADGDFKARTQLTGGDELGRLGASFDKLLDDRVAALANAHTENERMNDSVVNVLQAVNLMSQRDLTARAPVTPDLIGTVSDSINALTDETSKVLRGVTDIRPGAGRLGQGEVAGRACLQDRARRARERGPHDRIAG